MRELSKGTKMMSPVCHTAEMRNMRMKMTKHQIIMVKRPEML